MMRDAVVDFSVARRAIAALLEEIPERDEITDLHIQGGSATIRLNGSCRQVDLGRLDLNHAVANIAALTTTATGRELSVRSPILEQRIPPWFRVTCTHPSLVWDGSWAMSLRLLPPEAMPLERWVADGYLSSEDHGRLVGLMARPTTVLIAGTMGAGKALEADAPVLTPTGWRAIGTLRQGDPVLGPDGSVRMVTGVYPQGRCRVVKLIFRDGRSTVCSEDHLWKACSAAADWRVETAAKLRRRVDVAKRRKYANYPGIPLVSPLGVGGAPQALPVPPYVLGVLLGDGHIAGTPIVTNASLSVRARLAEALVATPYEVREPSSGEGRNCSIVRPGSRRGMANELAAIGLRGCRAHEKFIPGAYLDAMPQDRLELLRGLLDTDGTVSTKGGLSYSTSSEQLAYDVQRLAWSLGCVANLRPKPKPYYQYHGKRLVGRPSWSLSISHDDPRMLLTRPERRDRLPEKSTWRNHGLRLQIKDIEPAGEGECVCIAVDHPDGLYVTKDYIVTHNTRLLGSLIAEIPLEQRLVVVEDAADLSIARGNTLLLSATPQAELGRIIAHSFRHDAARVIVGEVRDASAMEFLTLASGGVRAITTIHAEPGVGGLTRLHWLAQQSGAHITIEQIEAAIHAVVTVDRLPDGRRPVSIWERG